MRIISIGKHLSEMGVRAEDTRDEAGRQRFHLFTPDQLMAPGHFRVLEKYSKRSIYPVVQVELYLLFPVL